METFVYYLFFFSVYFVIGEYAHNQETRRWAWYLGGILFMIIVLAKLAILSANGGLLLGTGLIMIAGTSIGHFFGKQAMRIFQPKQ